jgi:magnesium transporter
MNDILDEAASPGFAAPMAGLAREHPADIVERLNTKSIDIASAVLSALPLERAVEVFDEPGLERAEELIEAQPPERAASLFRAMSDDRAADIFRHLDEPVRERLFAQLDLETKASVARLLAYPENTAGSIMTTEFVSVPSTLTVGETLDYVRKVEKTRETIYAIYVLDPKTKTLVKPVSLRRLVTGAPEDPVLSVALPRRPITVPPSADREDVARLISKYDLLAVPVVDKRGHVLGIVTVDDIIDAMIEETTEDVQRFGGVEALDAPYMDIGFVRMIQKRAGWLCALFLGEMLTASAMQHFQSELEKAVVLTLFIPLIMSSGGNSGSQATSLIIRAVALQEVRLRDWWRVALRELPTGVTLGAILGVIGMVRIALWQSLGVFDYGEHWVLVAFTVGAALVGIVTFGSLAGSMLPFILKRIGFDPASASAPFVATLVDVTGLVIYFSIALVFLRGTLL